MAFYVALLDGAAMGALDLLRVTGKFGWYGERSDLILLFGRSAGLGIIGALLFLLPAVLLVRGGPRVIRRADPWPLFHGVWFGANVALLFVWKRYASVHEAGGDYAFSAFDLSLALLLGLLAGVVFGPTLARLWRVLGLAAGWPFRRLGLGGAAAGVIAAIVLIGGFFYGIEVTQLPRVEGGPGNDGKPKNVILVVADAVRSDHVGLYGYGADTTPHLDALAAKGSIVATRYFSNSSYTLPSIASIFTARNPAAHGVTDYGDVLRDDFTTLAEAFREAGYATGAFSATLLITPEFGFAQGFDTYQIFRDYRGDFFYARVLGGMGFVDYDKRADAAQVAARAISWLERNYDRPFFMMVFFADPHFDYRAPRHLIEKFTDPDYLRVTDLDEFFLGYAKGKLRDKESLAFAKSLYDAEIAFVDQAMRALWEAVELSGLEEKTVMLVTSDHGEQFYEHGTSRHGKSLYVEEIHCPLVIIDPTLGKSVRVETPARGIDLYPTLLDAAGLPVPEGLEGASLLPLAGKGPRGVRESLMMVAKENYLQAYWVDPWFLIFDRDRIQSPADRGLALYNLSADPGMQKDIAASRPEVVARMVTALDARVKESRGAGPAPEKPIASDRMELLRELHYVK